MTERKQERPLYLDMDFAEALERYSKVKPEEVPPAPGRARKKKPPGKPKPPGGLEKSKGDPPSGRKRKRSGGESGPD